MADWLIEAVSILNFAIFHSRCPVDDEIMGMFEYTHNLTRAVVSFQAHKFPYTSSVYYQCNVRLCLKESGGCEDVVSAMQQRRVREKKYSGSMLPRRRNIIAHVRARWLIFMRSFYAQPPNCDKNGRNYRRRRRRDVDLLDDGNLASVRAEDARDLSIEVYSGLYVNEADDVEGREGKRSITHAYALA